MTMQLPQGALAGIKVLDLSRWIAGPFCAMLMADAGADVIKVEGLRGEDARHSNPQLYGTSAYVHHYNRNKRAISVDLRTAEGREVIFTLATEWADVVIENLRPGVLDNIGLGYEALSKKKPDLIMTSISGFGVNGPEKDRPGFNTIAEAMSGAMSLTGDADQPPTMSGYFAADHSTGLYAAFGTMLALQHREKTGEGQLVELALADSMFSLLGFALTSRLNELDIPPRSGNRDSATAPADLFRSGDGREIYLDAGTDALFHALGKAMGQPEIDQEAAFATNELRLENWKALYRRIADWTESLPLGDISQALEEAHIPYAPVNTVDDAIAEPQFAAREMIHTLTTPDGNEVRIPGMVLKLSQTPGSIRSAAPAVGQHTQEILSEILGFDSAKITEMLAEGIVKN